MSNDNSDTILYTLKLFVAGMGMQALDCEEQIRSLLKDILAETYILEVIDVLQHPAKADKDDIIATPTLLVRTVDQERRIIGRLNNHEKMLDALGIS